MKPMEPVRNGRHRRTRQAPFPCGPLTAVNLESRTRRILEVAAETFLRRGYVDATLDEIACSAGTSPATLKSHGFDKPTLFRISLQAIVYRQGPCTIDVAATENTADILMRAAKYVNSSLLCARSDAALPMIVDGGAHFPDLVSAAGLVIYDELKVVVMNLLRELERCGRIDRVDHARATHMFISLLVGFPSRPAGKAGCPRGADDTIMQAKVDLFLNALTTKPSQARTRSSRVHRPSDRPGEIER